MALAELRCLSALGIFEIVVVISVIDVFVIKEMILAFCLFCQLLQDSI